MYAHLIRQDGEPVSTIGYKIRRHFRFTYGSLAIDAQLYFPQLSDEGRLELSIYSTSRLAQLMHGELPARPNAKGERFGEEELLAFVLPKADISYLLSLFGIRRSTYTPDELHRARVELSSARKYKWYERHELRITRYVDMQWLRAYGSVFGIDS